MDRVNTETEQTLDGEYEIETRPIRRVDAIEAGLDYWMDEVDLEKERQRKIAVKNRKVCILTSYCLFHSIFVCDYIGFVRKLIDMLYPSLNQWNIQQKAMEGQISRDKLKDEVIAPYKQNWIGIFSVMIIILSTIITKFPELMQIPVIPIPDLWSDKSKWVS